MITRNEIKLIRSLKTKKNRETEELFVVEGLKVLLEIRDAGFEIVKIFSTIPLDSIIKDNQEEISEKELNQISVFSTPHELVALVKKPLQRDDKLNDAGLIIGLDNIQDPGNLGTILRSAEWFGAKGILCSNDTVDLYNSKVIQASMGGIARQRVDFCDLEQALGELKESHTIVGASLEGTNAYKFEWPESTVLLIGNEAAGLNDKYDSLIDEHVTIPSFGALDSLNAAVACSILCSEYRRQY